MKRTITRRTMLKGVGTALALPMLEAMGPLAARAESASTRWVRAPPAAAARASVSHRFEPDTSAITTSSLPSWPVSPSDIRPRRSFGPARRIWCSGAVWIGWRQQSNVRSPCDAAWRS